mmetsp:Transcript_21939/g.62276  ORF Transcript_21939/g.62276 Transcript_21939/m.62276 type:complete len:256 (+) Transcript_21939:637-1404(+)
MQTFLCCASCERSTLQGMPTSPHTKPPSRRSNGSCLVSPQRMQTLHTSSGGSSSSSTSFSISSASFSAFRCACSLERSQSKPPSSQWNSSPKSNGKCLSQPQKEQTFLRMLSFPKGLCALLSLHSMYTSLQMKSGPSFMGSKRLSPHQEQRFSSSSGSCSWSSTRSCGKGLSAFWPVLVSGLHWSPASSHTNLLRRSGGSSNGSCRLSPHHAQTFSNSVISASCHSAAGAGAPAPLSGSDGAMAAIVEAEAAPAR